jgi:hypothetical protein
MARTNIGPQLRQGGVAAPFSAFSGDPVILVRGTCFAYAEKNCRVYLGWILG